MNYNKTINKLFEESANSILESRKLTTQISKIINLIIECIEKGNKILICGNGGSAADSQHFAAELIGRYQLERMSFPAIALTTDSSIITAVGNDYGFDLIFSRQCESLVKKNDIVIAISTSGNSLNVIKAIQASKKKGAITVGLLGGNGGDLQKMVDIAVIVPSKSTPRIQEVHRIIIHVICEFVEQSFKNTKAE